jgi:CubicO group peptidase (beta-lactamase class C family)
MHPVGFDPISVWPYEVEPGAKADELEVTYIARRNAGWRPISLGAYYQPPKKRYCVVWRFEGVPQTWDAFWGRDLGEAQALDAAYTHPLIDKHPYLVAAAGSASNARFAAVYDDEPPASDFGLEFATPHSVALFDVPIAQLDDFENLIRQGMTFAWAALYGDAADPRAALVARPYRQWREVAWTVDMVDTAAELGKFVEAHEMGNVRPHLLTAGAGKFLGIFYGDSIGLWAPLIDVPLHDLAYVLTGSAAQGFFPIRLQARKDGSSLLFTLIVAEGDQQIARQLTVRDHRANWFHPVPGPSGPASTTGPTTGVAKPSLGPAGPKGLTPIKPKPGGTGFATISDFPAVQGVHAVKSPMDGFDAFMIYMMQRLGVRAASLAIGRQSKLVYAKAFTLAEPGYPIATPHTAFRAFSLSKSITSIAIHKLVHQNLLSLDDGFIGRIQATPASGLLYDVKIDHLLQHRLPPFGAVWQRRWAGGLADWGRITQAGLGGPESAPFPLRVQDLSAHWMNQVSPFTFSMSASAYDYRNLNYQFLSHVIGKQVATPESLSPTDDFREWLMNQVWSAVGIPLENEPQRLDLVNWGVADLDEAYVPITQLYRKLPLEVPHVHDWIPKVEESINKNDTPEGPYWVPDNYNQNGYILAGAGAWVVSAVDLVRVLAALHDDAFCEAHLMPTSVRDGLMWADLGSDGYNYGRGWGQKTYSGYGGGKVLSHGGVGAGGRSTWLHDRQRGLSFAYLFNTSWEDATAMDLPAFPKTHVDAILEVADDVTAANGWPDVDLFPWFGLAPIV